MEFKGQQEKQEEQSSNLDPIELVLKTFFINLVAQHDCTALTLHHVFRGVVGPRVALDGSHGEHAPPRSPLEGPHPVPEPLRRT